MSHDRNVPPTEWQGLEALGITKVTDDIYYGWLDDASNPAFWHWCATKAKWMAFDTPNHNLVCGSPLHLEPSLLWPCCGLHGFVHNGEWASV